MFSLSLLDSDSEESPVMLEVLEREEEDDEENVEG